MKINIKVKPNSDKQEIIKISEGDYVVKVKSAARNNKANLELIKLLRKKFKRGINITCGANSKNKIIEIK